MEMRGLSISRFVMLDRNFTVIRGIDRRFKTTDNPAPLHISQFITFHCLLSWIQIEK